jgi:tRNA nucleotidyltransferase (CCA-adding enzyme)
MPVRLFEVGGSVRDRLLGVPSKDVDLAVEAGSFEEMQDFVRSISSKIFLEKPEFLTIRALVDGAPRDFVLCRKDGSYTDGRRPDSTTPGTIFDDLARRDFTVNAMAIDCESKAIIDPFGGQQDLRDRRLRCVGDPEERFTEDGLRLIRAIRFSIVKDLQPVNSIRLFLMAKESVFLLDGVSKERIREELTLCFKHSTTETMRFLIHNVHHEITERLFQDDLWLMPTLSKR